MANFWDSIEGKRFAAKLTGCMSDLSDAINNAAGELKRYNDAGEVQMDLVENPMVEEVLQAAIRGDRPDKEAVANALRALKTDAQLLADPDWFPEDPDDAVDAAIGQIKTIAKAFDIPLEDLELP